MGLCLFGQVALTLVLIAIALLYTGLKLWNKLEKQVTVFVLDVRSI